MQKEDGTVRKTRQAYNDLGQTHELTFSCYNRLPLLSKDRTRQWFVEALDQAGKRWNFEIWAYVVMPEHVHLLILPKSPDYRMASILKAIKQPVAHHAIKFLKENDPRWLERLKVTWSSGRTEFRFWQQGGGYDRNLQSSKIVCASIEYIHNNPVRRGLVNSPAEWLWSSARSYTGEGEILLDIDGCPPDIMKK